MISTWKPFWFFRLLNCLDFFGHVGKQRDQKNKGIFKIYDVINWKTNNYNTYILPNISRSKGNQTMKFGQWIDYNMRNIFFEKLCTKCDGETISRLLYKKPKLSISLINSLKFLYDFIYCLLSWGLSTYIETKLQSIFFYLI